MKTKLRRLTAMALVLSMVVSMVGILPAFASSSKDQIAKDSNSKDGFAYYTQDGTATTNAGLESVADAVYGSYNSANKGSASVEVYKSISGTDAENVFDIDLKVVTTDDISELEISPHAAVVLVFDTSMSMEFEVDTSSAAKNWTDTRMYQAQEAAKVFIEGFVDEAGDAMRMVSIVDFAQTASVQLDWIDAATKLSTVTDAIDDLSISTLGGTNMDDGLTKAEAQVTSLENSSKYDEIQSIYVVLLSDGAPTYYRIDSTGAAQSSSNSNIGSSTTASQTEAAADSLKQNTSAQLYTIAFAEGSSAAHYVSGTSGSTVSINNWLSEEIASSEDMHYDAANNETLSIGFEKIVERIVQLASAWQVVDPMGQFIVLDTDSVDGSDNVSFNSTETSIIWNLRNDTPATSGSGANKTYTYTLSYTITLNTAAPGFAEDTFYLTNGLTQLKYCFVDDATDVTEELAISTLDFKVPAVEGELPDYVYYVQHWLQVTGDDISKDSVLVGDKYYELADTGNAQKATIWDWVIEEKVETYFAKYDKYTNYTFNTEMGAAEPTDPNGIQIVADGQILPLYYDRNTTTATVNHYYYTVTETDGGVTVTLDNEEDPTYVYENLLYIGDKYEAATANKGDYTQITDAPDAETGKYTVSKNTDNEIITLVAQNDEKSENVVNYYYVYSIDNRTDVTIDVTHKYATYTWALDKDGRYEEVIASTSTDSIPTITQKYGTSFIATQVDKEGFRYSGYESEKGSFDGLSISSLTKPSSITLVYEQHIDNPYAYVDVTVEHIYRTETTSIDANGDTAIVTEITGTDSKTFTEEYRYGETFEADENTVYNDVTYPLVQVTPDDSITLGYDNNKITFEYLRTVDNRDETEVTVYHDYTYYYGFIDEEGNYSLETDEKTRMDYSETFNADVDGSLLYVGQDYTATTDSKGYDILTDDEDLTIASLKQSGNEIFISYELTEDLDAADVTVKHYYKTYTKTYVNGVISINKGFYALGYTESYDGHKGEKYTAEEIFEYDDNDDYLRVNDSSLTVTLSDDSKTINIFYYRVVEDYTETAVTVNHIFTTTTKYVDENGDVVSDVTEDDFSFDYYTDDCTDEGNQLYAGMIFTATEDETLGGEGFTASASNQEALLLVESAEDNVINLYYSKTETSELVDASVDVIYHYTTYTTTLVDGEAETNETSYETESWYPTVTGLYAGQFYTATSVTNGFEQITDEDEYTKVLMNEGLNVINIYYEKTIDETVSATLDVTHIYTTEYATGGEVVKTFYDNTIASWSTVKHVFKVDTNEDLYEVTDIDSDNDSVDEREYTIVLEAGENEITVEYYRFVDDRTPITVTVNHTYYVYDEYTEITTWEGTTSGSFTIFMEDSDRYTAELERTFNELTYSHDSGDRTIELDFEVLENNVVSLSYLRTIDTEPEVEEEEEDEPSTGGGSSSNVTYYSLTATYVDEDGNEIADEEYTSRIRSGSPYSTEEKDIDGYTFLKTEGDAPSGVIRSDKEVIYVYALNEIEIPDEDVPLTDTPDTPDTTTPSKGLNDIVIEIPTEDVPLAEVPVEETPEIETPAVEIPEIEIPEIEIPLSDIPQTGDDRNLAFLVATALLSAAGLSFLVKQELDEKKKRSSN